MPKKYYSIVIWQGVEVAGLEGIKPSENYQDAIGEFKKLDGFDLEDDLPLVIELTDGDITDAIIPSRNEIDPTA